MSEFKNEKLSEENVEYFVYKTITAYFNKHMLVDAMLWKEIIRLMAKKYKFEKAWAKEIAIQKKMFGEVKE